MSAATLFIYMCRKKRSTAGSFIIFRQVSGRDTRGDSSIGKSNRSPRGLGSKKRDRALLGVVTHELEERDASDVDELPTILRHRDRRGQDHYRNLPRRSRLETL